MADSYDFDIDAYCTVCERVISSRYAAPSTPFDSSHVITDPPAFAPASHTSSTSAGSRSMHRTVSNKRIPVATKQRRRSHVNVAALGRTAKQQGRAHKKATSTATREEIIEVIDDDPADEPLQAGLYCSDECRLIDEARSGLGSSSLRSSFASSSEDGFAARRRRSSVRFSTGLPPIPSAAPSAVPTAAIDQHADASSFPFPSAPLDFGARRHSTRAYRPTLIERTSSEAYSFAETASGLSKSAPRPLSVASASASDARPKSPRSPPLSRTLSSGLSSRPPPFFIGSAPSSSRGPLLTSRSSASLALLGTSFDAPRTGTLISLSGFVARGEILPASVLPASASTAATVTFATTDAPSSPSSYAPSVFSEQSTAFTASSDRLSSSGLFSRELHKVAEPPPRASGLTAGLATGSKFYL